MLKLIALYQMQYSGYRAGFLCAKIHWSRKPVNNPEQICSPNWCKAKIFCALVKNKNVVEKKIMCHVTYSVEVYSVSVKCYKCKVVFAKKENQFWEETKLQISQ